MYRNEAGEPLGWDYPANDEPDYDPDAYLPQGDEDDEEDESVEDDDPVDEEEESGEDDGPTHPYM